MRSNAFKRIKKIRGGYNVPGPLRRVPGGIKKIIQDGVNNGDSLQVIRHRLGMNWNDNVYAVWKLAKSGVKVFNALSNAKSALTATMKAFKDDKGNGGDGPVKRKRTNKKRRDIIPTILANGPVALVRATYGKIKYPENYSDMRKIQYRVNDMGKIDGANYGRSVTVDREVGTYGNWKTLLDLPGDTMYTSTPVFLNKITFVFLLTNRDECTAHVTLADLTAVKQHGLTVVQAVTAAYTQDMGQTNEQYIDNYPFFNPAKLRSVGLYWRRLADREYYVQPGASIRFEYTFHICKNVEYGDLSSLPNFHSGVTYAIHGKATGFPINDTADDSPSLAKPHFNWYHEAVYTGAYGTAKDPRFGKMVNAVDQTITSEKKVGAFTVTDTDGDI